MSEKSKMELKILSLVAIAIVLCILAEIHLSIYFSRPIWFAVMFVTAMWCAEVVENYNHKQGNQDDNSDDSDKPE